MADPHGTATAVRYYWANKSRVVLSDLPSEARLLPALCVWGGVRFELPDILDRVPGVKPAPSLCLLVGLDAVEPHWPTQEARAKRDSWLG